LGYQFLKFYSDPGFSGKSIESRPGLQALLKDAQAGKFDLVMFTKLDRLGRNLRDLLNVWHLFQDDYKLDLFCIDQDIDTRKPAGKMMLHLLGAFAEFERTQIEERTQGGRKKKWKDGECFIGQPPFGYRWNKEKAEIEVWPEQKAIYEGIVSSYIDENYDLREIAEILTSEGIPAPSKWKNWNSTKGTRWNHVAVRDILFSNAYKGGEVTYGDFKRETVLSKKSGQEYMRKTKEKKPEAEWVEVTFPALISHDRWEQIQAKREFNIHRIRKRHKEYEDHFLAQNAIRCGECGGKMRARVTKKNQGRYTYLSYACYWKIASQKELANCGKKRCILKEVKSDSIDETVWRNVVDAITDPARFAKDWLKDVDIEEAKAKFERLTAKAKELERRLEAGFNHIRQTTDSHLVELYQRQQAKDEKEFREVQLSLGKAKAEYDLVKNKVDRLKEFENAYKNADFHQRQRLNLQTKGKLFKFLYDLPFNEKRRIVEAVVSPETGGHVEVRYLMPMDVLDYDVIPEKGHYRPLMDEKPVVEMHFQADLNKIEALIGSLGKDLNKLESKVSTHGTPRRSLCVGGWGRVL